jgi:hypothetical protein
MWGNHLTWLHVGPAEPVIHPHITLTDKEQEIISALEATLSPALHAAAMVSAFVAGQSESNLFGVLEQVARARCSRVCSSTMDTQPRALQAVLGCNSNRGLAYDLYDSLNARADQKTAQLPEGVLSSQNSLVLQSNETPGKKTLFAWLFFFFHGKEGLNVDCNAWWEVHLMHGSACADKMQQGRGSTELRLLVATSALLAALRAVADAEGPRGICHSAGLTGSLQTMEEEKQSSEQSFLSRSFVWLQDQAVLGW